jgi:hypothetical protein
MSPEVADFVAKRFLHTRAGKIDSKTGDNAQS